MKYRIFFTIPNLENLFMDKLEPLYFGTKLYIDLEGEDAAVGINLMSRGKMMIEVKLREVLGFDVDSVAITGIIVLA